MSARRAAILLAAPTLISGIVPACAQGQVAVRGAVVHPVAGAPITDGVVLVGPDGRIEAVGPASGITIPDGYELLEAEVVTPGLVDARSVVGLSGILAASFLPTRTTSSCPPRSSRSCAPSMPTTPGILSCPGSGSWAPPPSTPAMDPEPSSAVRRWW